MLLHHHARQLRRASCRSMFAVVAGISRVILPAVRLELITETAPIASRLPKRLLPTNDVDSIKKSITEALEDAKKDKADDPNRLNYTINAVEAIVENRSQRTEQNLRAELASMREELSDLAKVVETQQEVIMLLRRVAAKLEVDAS